MTATRRPRPGRMMTGPRRMIHAVRYVNDELMRASEAIIRSARVPQPRSQATVAENRETAAQQLDRAALSLSAASSNAGARRMVWRAPAWVLLPPLSTTNRVVLPRLFGPSRLRVGGHQVSNAPPSTGRTTPVT